MQAVNVVIYVLKGKQDKICKASSIVRLSEAIGLEVFWKFNLKTDLFLLRTRSLFNVHECNCTKRKSESFLYFFFEFESRTSREGKKITFEVSYGIDCRNNLSFMACKTFADGSP